MPSHPDRVRRNACPRHSWIQIFGVYRIDPHHHVLDGYECTECGTIISRNEYEALKGIVKPIRYAGDGRI